MAFVIVGLPGILIAAILRFTLVEPVRGMSENRQAKSETTKVGDVISLLKKRRSFWHIAMGASLNGLVVYGVASWTASFMIRSHGLGTTELGIWLAMILGVGGAMGVLLGGFISDRLSVRDKRWYMWVPVLAGLISLPFSILVYITEAPYVALSLSIIPGILYSAYLGPTVAALHGLVGLRMRTLASALLAFIANIIGLGIGPLIIGALSDFLNPSLGAESLRYAMLLIIPIVQFWALTHFFLAARSLRQDMAAAPN